MKSQGQDGLDGDEKVPRPKWADMSASGKFVVLVFWFMVIQLIQSYVIPPLAMYVGMPLELFGLI